MESYIVRIYRAEKDNPSGLVGVVEQVGRAGRRAFTNLDEMWEILNPKSPKRGKFSKKGRSERKKDFLTRGEARSGRAEKREMK